MLQSKPMSATFSTSSSVFKFWQTACIHLKRQYSYIKKKRRDILRMVSFSKQELTVSNFELLKPQVIPISGPPSPNPAYRPTKIFRAEEEERKGLKSSTLEEAKHITRGGWGHCCTIIPRRRQRQLGGGQLGQRRGGWEAANEAAGTHPMKCTSVGSYSSRKYGDYSWEIKGRSCLRTKSWLAECWESCAAGDIVLQLIAHA